MKIVYDLFSVTKDYYLLILLCMRGNRSIFMYPIKYPGIII